jgi:hypothetical protein
MANEILEIDISSGPLDNVYTFYDDGTIKRFYDANPYSLNNTVFYKWEDLTGRSDLSKILDKCTVEEKAILKKFFLIT